MASPFRVFRKNQKMLIVTAGIMAMFAFVVADPLISMMGRAGGGESKNPIVATWQGEELRRSDLERERIVRQICRQFLLAAREMGVNMTGRQPMVPVVVSEVNDNTIIETMLMADQARRMGFSAGDDIVNRYLELLTQNSVRQNQFSSLLRQVRGRNNWVTESVIFDVLASELVAEEYARTYQLTGQMTMPNERWEAWKKLNDLVRLEVVPVSVEAFLDQVEEPSEEEVQGFYDQYRGVVDRSVIIESTEYETPAPGFMTPDKVSLESLKADFDAIVDRLAKEVTDEEVAEYYEQNKADYVRVELEEETEEESTTDDSSGEKETDGSESADAEPDSAKPTDDSAGAADDAGAATDESEETPTSEDASDSQATGPEGSTWSVKRTVFRLTSQTVEDANSDEASGEQPPAPRPDEADDKPAAAKETTDDGVQAPAASDGESTESVEATDSAEGTTPEASESSDADEESDEEVEYQPLDEVADDIRRQIARGKAGEEMGLAMAKPIEVMRDFAIQYSAWDTEQAVETDVDGEDGEAATSSPPPTAPSLEELAEENGLVYEKTPLLSHSELRDTPLGKCVAAQARLDVAGVAFGTRQLYRPFISLDTDLNRYIVWKVAKQDAHEVPLEKIRDEVVRAWKMPKARELALAEAEKLAEEATSKGGTLQDVFGSSDQYEVIETDPFSTHMNVSMMNDQVRVRLSDVDGVDGAGREFISKAMELKPGDVAVETNHAETYAYVMRLAEREKSLSELHEEFMRSVIPGDLESFQIYQQLSQEDGRRAYGLLLQSVVDELDFQQPAPEESSAN